MSDVVRCDHCKAVGRRAMGTVAPPGWLYAEFDIEGDSDEFVVFACGAACAVVVWHEGPGKLDLTKETRP